MLSYLAPMEIVGINEDAPAYLRKKLNLIKFDEQRKSFNYKL